jgi:selenide, water dikinase
MSARASYPESRPGRAGRGQRADTLESVSTASDALTSLSHGAGCGCKLPAAALLPIVRGLNPATDERLLVGSATADDAAVFRLSDELALVQTIDFFTPIVDDPYDFGRIAAANALSDVYAMGGTPLVALNIVAFPLERLGAGVLGEILRGGLDVVSAAGATLAGGHSIDDPEPKYGLSVTGIVHPDEVMTNAGALPGDLLVLTKPLGVGAITTALKRGLTADADLLARGVDVMAALNASAATAARDAGAHAITDITGFGLLGHLHNLCRASGVAATIDAAAVPAIDGVLELLADPDGQAVSGGSRRNREYAATFTSFAFGVAAARLLLLCDATTSGGLLVAVSEDRAALMPGPVVGRVVAGEAGTIVVR